MTNAGSPAIALYLQNVLDGISDGLKDRAMACTPVKFRLQTTVETNKDGKLDIKVVSLGADINQTHIQEVEFSAVLKPKPKE